MKRSSKKAVVKLASYLGGIAEAKTADELEAAIQAPYEYGYLGPVWSRVCKARTKQGRLICAEHRLGHLVPRLEGRRLVVCGKSMRVWSGDGHMQSLFAKRVLREQGVTVRAACLVWDWAWTYPHRALKSLEKWERGELADPQMDTLILVKGGGSGSPVNYTTEENDTDAVDRRATMGCKCGGTLFDWGGGFCSDFMVVNWRCNGCPRVFQEYVTTERMKAIRRPRFVTASGRQDAVVG